MTGTGPVAFGRDVVYAYYTLDDGRAAQVRLSQDECGRLDLFPGRQVRVGLADCGPVAALVTAVTAAPPFAWVGLELVALPGSRAG